MKYIKEYKLFESVGNKLNYYDQGLQYLPQLPSSLEHLLCSYNKLTYLPELPKKLIELDCDHNHLLSLPELPNTLKKLFCNHNLLLSLPKLPTSLDFLECEYNNINSMPELPAKLIELYCHNNILTTLPKLPSNLLILDCFDNKLTSLPELQNSLRELNCNNNYLTFLPELPDSLIQLSCDNNKLTSLPKLPQTLENLFCNSIELTSLPELPNSIQILHCNGNNLEYLPELPKSLRIFSCSNNKWKEPIKKEIVDKFNLYALYTKEHIELFSSEEYQRDFLTEHPERFQDLSCEGITVHPVIRKEFSYIFEGEGMGFFNLVKESKDISDDEKIYFIKKCVDIYAEKKQYKPSLIPKEIYGLYLNDLPFYDNYFVKYIEKFLLGDNAYYYVKFNNKENPENSNFSRNIYNCDCDELSIIYDYLVKQYPDMGSIIEGDKMGFFDLKTNESK